MRNASDRTGGNGGRFDAVLIVAFGGPHGRADIRPFLERVLRGRRVTPDRIEEVAHHYEIFDGVSPITELTRLQAQGLQQRLCRGGISAAGLRRNAQLAPAARRYASKEMHSAGIRRAVGFIAAAHHSYSSCQQYRENVAHARRELRAEVGGDVDITYVGSWFDHPLFIEVNARHVRAAARAPSRGCSCRGTACLHGPQHSAVDAGRVALP